MKIQSQDATSLNHVQDTKSQKKTSPAQTSPARHASEAVKAELSEAAIEKSKRLASEGQRIEKLAKGAPELREDRIEALRAQIQNGEYQVPVLELADRMLKDHVEIASRNRSSE